MMETRFLGKSGLELSVFGFGCMTFSDGEGRFGATGSTSGADAARQVDLCMDHGINFFDTADVYAAGRSEEILGQALGKRRNRVHVATKAFHRMGKAAHDVGLSRRHLIEACDASLRRLGTDWIDLYQVHSFDGLTPQEETLRALDDLVRSGKVRYIGCSNFAAWQLARALGISERERLTAYIGQQIQYSLVARTAEEELLPCGVEIGVGAIIWSPLAQGFLSGKFRGQSGGNTRLELMGALKAYDNQRCRDVLAAVDAVVEARGNSVTHSQVALNWLKSRAGVTSVLLGARTDEQLLDNLAAATWSLTEAEIEGLDRASQAPMHYPVSMQYSYGSERYRSPFKRFD
ncbi:aldo/keto reductase [Blastomonas fulva]|jgi:aryl-alcohol dehydrogenase-like predicted oxidoreductase|uniref:aldo/keto reductase n=1 Tax=Blastomonas fulva TaxID=1550728 RepID=UPI003D2D2893